MTKQQSDNKSSLSKLLRLPHHEYWPWWLLVAPMWPFWIWYGVRLRNFTWFTAVNPGIEDGGFMGESKKAIQEIVPLDLQPKTYYINADNSLDKIRNSIDLTYPYIAKPDIGGRGRKIAIIKNATDLELYNEQVAENYMLQEMIHSPLELGVFFVKKPNERQGYVTSLTSKGFLQVQGDGVSSVRELMKKDERAEKQVDRIEKFIDVSLVPKQGEAVLLEQIGNHSLGTKFINESHRIDERLHEVFSNIASGIDGFYYGRFDLRVTSWKDLYAGKNISILELNGLTSDVTHIFDPNFPTKDVFKVQHAHIKKAYQIAQVNLKQGVKTTPITTLAKKTWAALQMM